MSQIQVQSKIESKWWRLTNLYKIRTKNREVAKFKPNDLQKKILLDVYGQKPIKHYTIKTRQVGLSTLWLLYWLDDTIFNHGTITGVLAHKWESLASLWSILRIALNNMPSSLKPKLKDDSKTKMSFTNNSEIFVSLSIRSTAVHNLHISEWCFCDNDAIWASLGACSKLTNITGESTGNGMGNDGYMTWMDAKEGKNEYKTRFIPWYDHAEYSIPVDPAMRPFVPDPRERSFNLSQSQINFRRTKLAQLKTSFFIEYPETEEDAFSQSGAMFFNSKKIVSLVRDARAMDNESPPLEQGDYWTIWERPQQGHRYAMGADTSEGLDQDFSAFKILCLDCRQEAMAYRGHVGIDTFYRDLDKYGRMYNNALLGVERNNHGHAVLLGLVENCHYPHLYKEVREQPIVQNISKPRPEPKYGWQTTNISKPLMLDHLKLAIEGESEEDENTFQPDYVVRDIQFLSECLTIERDGVKLGAAAGKHDDTVIAAAIAYQMYLRLKSKLSSGLEKVVALGQREYGIYANGDHAG